MATLRDELDADGAGKALVIVNSYREAEDARDRIEQEFRRKGQAIKVAALVRNNHEHREHFVPRSEVYKFCDHPAKVLVAPAMAIERGFNIVDRGGHAVFTSLIFSVRPMGTPHDLGGRYRKLNGLIEREVATTRPIPGSSRPRSGPPPGAHGRPWSGTRTFPWAHGGPWEGNSS